MEKGRLPWFADGRFPLVLAPMAGHTDRVFRQLCKEHGADLLVSEFVKCDAIVRDIPKVWESIEFSAEQRPMGVQIFGADPVMMGEAAAMIEERLSPDFIDINFGCPADKVTCQNAGSSMLKDLPLMGKVIGAVASALKRIPVTVKIRTGWDSRSLVAREAGEVAVASGAAALAIHGRTKVQGYSGDADWDLIGEVAAHLPIPVIGNGAIERGLDPVEIRRNYAVSGIMIGRRALGYPWIFQEWKALMAGEENPVVPADERWQTLLRFAHQLKAIRFADDSEEVAVRKMRPRLLSFTKGLPGGRGIRGQLSKATRLAEVAAIAEEALQETVL